MKETYFSINNITYYIQYRFIGSNCKSIFILPGFGKSSDSIYTKFLFYLLPEYVNIFYINHRGHSMSNGIFYFGKYETYEIALIIKNMTKIFQLNFDKNYFIGFSIGGSIFYNIAKKTRLINNLLLVSPPFNWYEILPRNIFAVLKYLKYYKERFVFPNFFPFPFPIFNSTKNIKKFIIIHNLSDWLISYKHIENYKKNEFLRLVTYDLKYPLHAEEILYSMHEDIVNIILNFINENKSFGEV